MTVRQNRLTTMPVLDALFDRIHRISSNAEVESHRFHAEYYGYYGDGVDGAPTGIDVPRWYYGDGALN
jgi:hypothetical protein